MLPEITLPCAGRAEQRKRDWAPRGSRTLSSETWPTCAPPSPGSSNATISPGSLRSWRIARRSKRARNTSCVKPGEAPLAPRRHPKLAGRASRDSEPPRCHKGDTRLEKGRLRRARLPFHAGNCQAVGFDSPSRLHGLSRSNQEHRRACASHAARSAPGTRAGIRAAEGPATTSSTPLSCAVGFDSPSRLHGLSRSNQEHRRAGRTSAFIRTPSISMP